MQLLKGFENSTAAWFSWMGHSAMWNWANLTEPQAVVLGSLITVLAAVIGVLLGWWLFSGKVKDLSDAVEATEEIVRRHQETTTESLRTVAGQVTDTVALINTLRGQFADQSSDPEANEEVEPAEPVQEELDIGEPVRITQQDVRFALVDSWDAIRAEIERRAANPDIDGRTRGKYNRIDRRNYRELIESMIRDGNLPDAALFREAHELWMKYRNNRKPVPMHDISKLADIRGLIAPAEI